MNHLNITTSIDRPQHDVIVRLKKFFDEHAPGGEMRFTLRAPAELPYIHVGVTFERDVIGTVDHLGGKRRAYRFSWRPAAAGPFPIFRGAIVVDEDENDAGRSLMTLDGRYEPPLDLAGQVFDAVIGTGSLVRFARRIIAPTVVVHGTDDPMVRVRNGRSLARLVRGARFVVVDGMGHDLPSAVWRPVATVVAQNAARA